MKSSFAWRYANARQGKFQFQLRQDNTTFVREEGNPYSFAQLARDDLANEYILTDVDGSQRTFDQYGKLLTREDRHGNVLRAYSYDDGKLESITDVSGRITTFEYNGYGNPTAIIDFDGAAGELITYLQYNGYGRLDMVQRPAPDNDSPYQTTRYEYYDSGNATDLLKAVIDPRGLRTEIEYDHTRHVSSITERCGGEIEITSIPALTVADLQQAGSIPGDLATLVETNSTDPFDITTIEHRDAYGTDQYITRNANNHVTSLTVGESITEYDYKTTGNAGTFNTVGLLEDVIQSDPDGSGPLGPLSTTYSYNDDGQLTYAVHPIGYEQIDRNGPFGQIDQYVDAEGNTTLYTFDADDNIETMTQVVASGNLVTSYTYTDVADGTIIGLVETITDPNGNVTRYTYNSQGLVETVVNAENTDDEITVEYEYDDRDRVESMTVVGRGTTQYVYDNLDRLIERIDPDPDGPGSGNPLTSPVWEYFYDLGSNQTHIIDPNGNVTQYVYDVRDRPIQVIQPVIDPSATPAVTTKDDSQGTFNLGTWSQYGVSGAVNNDIYQTSDNGGKATYAFTGLDADKKYAVEVRWGYYGAAYDQNAQFKVFGNTGQLPLTTWHQNLNYAPDGLPDGSNRTWLSLGAFSPYSNTLTVVLSDHDNNGKLVIDAVRIIEVGPVTEFEYDCNGNLTETTDALGHLTEFQYDNLNQLVFRTDPDPDGVGGTYESPGTFYTYNDAGWLSSMYDPEGNVTLYQYDAMGRPTKEINISDESGLTAELYDSAGTLLETRVDADIDFAVATVFAGFDDPPDYFTAIWEGAFYIDLSGNIPFYLDHTDDAELYVDDELVITNSSGAGMEEESGSIELTTGWHTLRIVLTDLDLGQSGLIVSYNPGSGKAVIPTGVLRTSQVTTTDYDSAGRVEFVTDPLKRGVGYTYDGANRIARSAEGVYDPVFKVFEELTGGAATDYVYDDDDNTVTATNALNEATIYTYDHVNRLKTLDVINNAVSEVTEYAYDDAGNLTSLTDPENNETTWLYDNMNRVQSESIVIDSNPHTRSYKYDPNSNLTETIDRNSRIIKYKYDNLDRIMTEKWYNGTTLVQTTSYEFDDVGNLLSVADPIATYDYGYDGLNRVSTVEHSNVFLTPAIEFARGYDAASRLTSSSVEIGGTADYANSYLYDGLGRQTRVTQTSNGGNAVNNKRVGYAYNQADQMRAMLRYASTTTASPVAISTFDYDPRGRVEFVYHTGVATGSTYAEEYGYQYDNAHRITDFSSLIDGSSIDFEYDDRGQLTGAEDTGTTFDESYDYDDNGNREEANGDSYQTDPFNRILSDGIYDYVYDNEGNIIRKTDPVTGEYTAYTWDHRNRLNFVVEWNDNGTPEYTVDDQYSQVVAYYYDAFDQLVRRLTFDTSTWTSTVFVHDQGQVVLQFDLDDYLAIPNGDLSHRYLWGPLVDGLLADEQVDWTDSDADGETIWALTDHLGSVRDVVDSNGDLRIHRRFDSFGNVVGETHYNASGSTVTSGQTGYVDEAFAFTGRYFDKDTGLQNNLHRWYDPAIGRWLSEDPIQADVNSYRYVGNAPAEFLDFDGTEARWFNNNWHDWANPFAWAGWIGDGLGERIGNGYGAVTRDYSATWEAARLNQERLINGIANEDPTVTTNDFGFQRRRDVGRGVSEAIDGGAKVVDGAIAAAELGCTVGGLAAGLRLPIRGGNCPTAPKTGPTGLRPGSVSGNPANRLMETGTPLKNGQGWVKRWTRATAEDVAAQNQAIFDRYQQLLEASKNMPSDVAHQYRFEQMRQFRMQYRQEFLKSPSR